jgi:hypothetical protein
MWYTLCYTRANGEKVALVNLQAEGAGAIEEAQRHLGAHAFERIAQPSHFDWEEWIAHPRTTGARKQREALASYVERCAIPAGAMPVWPVIVFYGEMECVNEIMEEILAEERAECLTRRH